jgi:hypothetical protein
MRVQIFHATGHFGRDDLQAEINRWFEGAEQVGHLGRR